MVSYLDILPDELRKIIFDFLLISISKDNVMKELKNKIVIRKKYYDLLEKHKNTKIYVNPPSPTVDGFIDYIYNNPIPYYQIDNLQEQIYSLIITINKNFPHLKKHIFELVECYYYLE